VRGVLRNIQRYFAAGKHEEGTKSIIKSTGPGIWSDAITEHVLAQYGIRFGVGEDGVKEESASDDKGPFSHKKMHHKGAHIGDVLLLPTRAFAMGSGGTSLGPGEEGGDQLVHHNFKGTWKKGYVDMDRISSSGGGSSSSGSGSSSSGGDGGAASGPRQVSDVGTLVLPPSEERLGVGGDGKWRWCVGDGAELRRCTLSTACSDGNVTVLGTAVVALEGRNPTGVTAHTLQATAEGLQLLWLRSLANAQRKPPPPGVSALTLCGGGGASGAWKAGRGLVHGNQGGRFKHKTIRYTGPPLVPAAKHGAADGPSPPPPLVFLTARVPAGSQDRPVFAASVWSSALREDHPLPI
jgi:hypothetical protein